MNRDKSLWDECLRKFKILKIKTIRSAHRFKQKGGVSLYAKGLVLIIALKAITAVAPNVQVKLYSQDRNNKTTKDKFSTEYITHYRKQFPNINSYTKDSVNVRQSDFAKDLWETLSENIKEIKKGTAKGQKSRTIKKVFGNDVNTKYYCSISGLRSLEQTINKKGYHEYDFLVKCIANPHACLSVIDGLEKHFGKQAKTNNIKEKLHNTLEKNVNSVCIAIVNTEENSSSGKHFVFVLPNKVVVDGAINEADTLKGTVVSFNVDKIVASDTYFKGSRNTGYLFNITEIAEDDLVRLFYDKYKKNMENKNNKLLFAENDIPSDNIRLRHQFKEKQIMWHAVSTNSQKYN